MQPVLGYEQTWHATRESDRLHTVRTCHGAHTQKKDETLNYLYRCWRHRSRHSPSTSTSESRSVEGRIGSGSFSSSGGLISRRKSSRNLRKVFSSVADPAISSHYRTHTQEEHAGSNTGLLERASAKRRAGRFLHFGAGWGGRVRRA